MALENLLSLTRTEPEVITPAKETPNHILYLSEMDLMVPVHIPMLCVYENDDSKGGRSSKTLPAVLKEALSQVLVFYFPLAGRLKVAEDDEDRVDVNCNSHGILFAEAEAKCTLEDVLFFKDPPFNPSQHSSLFLHFDPALPLHQIPLLTIQVTMFRCGGFVIGMKNSHRVMDGQGASQFMKHFAEIARKGSLSTFPVWERERLKPRNPPQINVKDCLAIGRVSVEELFQYWSSVKPMCHAKLHIPEVVIERLKYRVVQESQGSLSFCSTFEAMVILIWKTYAQVTGFQRCSMDFGFPCNTRRALKDILSEGYYGNCSICTVVSHENLILTKGKEEFAKDSDIVRAVRDAKETVDAEYVRSWIDYQSEERRKKKPVIEMLVSDKIIFNDWSRFDWVADFGVGKGRRVVIPFDSISPNNPFAVFLPREDNDTCLICFTLLISLPEHAMPAFQSCFSQYTTPPLL